MPSGKARFNKTPTFVDKIRSSEPPPELIGYSDDFKGQIKAVYVFTGQDLELNPDFDNSANQFVEEVLMAVDFVKTEIQDDQLLLNKEDLRAEQASVLKSLESARDKLRSLSLDFDRLLDVGAEPEDCADTIDNLIPYVRSSAKAINQQPKTPRPDEMRHHNALELAGRIVSAIKSHDLKIPVSFNSTYHLENKFLLLIQDMGKSIGLDYAASTWVDTINKATSSSLKVQK